MIETLTINTKTIQNTKNILTYRSAKYAKHKNFKNNAQI